MKLHYRALRFGLSTLLLSSSFTVAHAWTGDIDNLTDANTACKLEPGAQCTSAVRVGINAPGLDMNHSSMEKMRSDRRTSFTIGPAPAPICQSPA